MALKFLITPDEYDDLDESFQGLYARDGDEGDWTLDTEGDAPGLSDLKKRIGEFRDTNTRLKVEKEELEAAKRKLEEGSGETDRVKALEKKWEARWAKSEERRLAAEKEVRDKTFTDVVRRAAKQAGVADNALDTAVDHLRHRGGMRLQEDGEVKSDDSTTLTEALRAMKKSTPFFFADSQGGGTPPGGPGRRRAPPGKRTGDLLGTDPDHADKIFSGELQYDPEAA